MGRGGFKLIKIMGAKKKKAGGKKKKGGGESYLKEGDVEGDLDPREAAQLLAIQAASLKSKLGKYEKRVVKEQEKADESKAAENELRNRVTSLDKIMEEEKQDTWKIT